MSVLANNTMEVLAIHKIRTNTAIGFDGTKQSAYKKTNVDSDAQRNQRIINN
jgi:hypothetical protein